MTGVSFTVDLDRATLGRADDLLARLAGADLNRMVNDIAGVVESQTRRRLELEKTGPDGGAWAPWSEAYADSRHSGHSLLIDTQGMLDSIESGSSGLEAKVGVYVNHAGFLQFGTDKMPARPYLGLSADNRAEIEQLVVDMLDGVLA